LISTFSGVLFKQLVQLEMALVARFHWLKVELVALALLLLHNFKERKEFTGVAMEGTSSLLLLSFRNDIMVNKKKTISTYALFCRSFIHCFLK
jgi:hypothetical protein